MEYVRIYVNKLTLYNRLSRRSKPPFSSTGREKELPPPPEDTSALSSFRGVSLLDGKHELEPALPVATEEHHETAAAGATTCPGETNTPVGTGEQVKPAQVAELEEPVIVKDPVAEAVVHPQEENWSELTEANRNPPAILFSEQVKVNNDPADVVARQQENKSETSGGGAVWAPWFVAAGMDLLLSLLPSQETATTEDEKIISLSKTETNTHRDPVIDLERKQNATNDKKASIAPEKEKPMDLVPIWATNANPIVTASHATTSAGYLSLLTWGSSCFEDISKTFDAMNANFDTRMDDETAYIGGLFSTVRY
jgi:hypothetical protein